MFPLKPGLIHSSPSRGPQAMTSKTLSLSLLISMLPITMVLLQRLHPNQGLEKPWLRDKLSDMCHGAAFGVKPMVTQTNCRHLPHPARIRRRMLPMIMQLICRHLWQPARTRRPTLHHTCPSSCLQQPGTAVGEHRRLMTPTLCTGTLPMSLCPGLNRPTQTIKHTMAFNRNPVNHISNRSGQTHRHPIRHTTCRLMDLLLTTPMRFNSITDRPTNKTSTWVFLHPWCSRIRI